MEHYWTKKRMNQLLAAEAPALEQWLDDFTGPIYTWLYYQTAGDTELAAELTGKTFCAAVSNLTAFNPAAETMYHWLKDQAKQTRDEVFLHRQMKPQRPWAWSQLPNDVLCALANLRSEQLPEEVANNPCVQAMTQAALVEMGHLERELMMHRYNHLDTPERIAEELGQSAEQIADRLYRCRHFFRRVFTQLVQSENAGFTDSSAGGEMELLDTNLEKLLAATAMNQPMAGPHKTVLRDTVKRCAAENAAAHKPNGQSKIPLMWISIAGVAVLVIIAVFFIITNASKETPPAPTPNNQTAGNTDEQPAPKQPTAKPGEIDKELLLKVLNLGESGNLNGLLEIFKGNSYEIQLAASHYLGKLGDESTIGLLMEAEQRWYPDGSEDNVFALAIARIEERLLTESGAMIEEPQPEEAQPQPEPEKPAAEQPRIAGSVTAPDGSPIEDARIVLTQAALIGEPGGRQILTRIRTDAQGRYSFEQEMNGPVFADCAIPPSLTQSTRKATLCQKQSPSRVDFGNGNVVSGRLTLSDQPAANQILYLSDTMDPTNAAFRCETVTRPNGLFTFPGVTPGNYYLLYNTSDNKIVWLDSIDVDGGDRMGWDVTADEYSLSIKYQLPPDTIPLEISKTVLTYGPDASTEFKKYTLLQDDNDANQFSVYAPTGSYTLVSTFENGMQLQQAVELTDDRAVTVSIPPASASLEGTFSSPSPLPLFLFSEDQGIRFDLKPDQAGNYALDSVPAGTYTLTTVINEQSIDFLEIDIEAGQPQTLDIDPAELMQSVSGLYVIVIDENRHLIAGAQVWLTGDGQIVTTQSTGRGAFLAAPAGEYALHAAYPGSTAVEKIVRVPKAALPVKPNPENTVVLQITR